LNNGFAALFENKKCFHLSVGVCVETKRILEFNFLICGGHIGASCVWLGPAIGLEDGMKQRGIQALVELDLHGQSIFKHRKSFRNGATNRLRR